MTDREQNITRLAPSPTGALHLGNARTFLINWAIARQSNKHLVMRIEDLDSPRVKPGADQQAIDDLQWLGMDWDEQAPHQLTDLQPYTDALDHLSREGLTYACTCTRREIEQAQSAPHEGDHELRYPGTCKHQHHRSDNAATRIIMPDEAITFVDEMCGQQTINVQQQVGDFVISTKAGLPAYQLAVVVDDASQGVTDVVRGDDLLASTARQLWLYKFLDLQPPRRWYHLPLVKGADGKRLAKRHGDTRIAMYREMGVSPQRIVGLLAHWCGMLPSRDEMDARAFAQQFDLTALPRQSVTFTQEDHAWLIAGV